MSGTLVDAETGETLIGVEEKMGRSTTIDFALFPGAIGMDEVVVEARALETRKIRPRAASPREPARTCAAVSH